MRMLTRPTLPEIDGLTPSSRRALRRQLEAILARRAALEDHSDATLASLVAEVRESGGGAGNDAAADAAQVEVFAAVSEAVRRSLGFVVHPNQILAGLVIAEGGIAELATGEGKTVVATFPTTWYALAGEGVLVATANEYLAARDAEWMGRVYRRLGLSVGVTRHGLAVDDRKAAYAADITYGTATQFGFDYLYDNQITDLAERAQRASFAAVVDEADSILIDEARTPLILSGPGRHDDGDWARFARFADSLVEGEHYEVERDKHEVALTSFGVRTAEEFAQVEDLWREHKLAFHINAALTAKALYRKDVEYLVKEDAEGILRVVLIDEHTGRTMETRRVSDGIHEALEAKEHVPVQPRTSVVATITLQSFFRRFTHLGGMTGTAADDAEELERTYKTRVAMIPTHHPILRVDHPDRLFATTAAKHDAIVEDVKTRRANGQPVLIGAPSVTEAEEISEVLAAAGVEHHLLSARNHAAEAAILAQAGRIGIVTVATNMAGRGVDIRLGGDPEGLAAAAIGVPAGEEARLAALATEPGLAAAYADALAREEVACAAERERVIDCGGLYVLGTARHVSRRIDNQLRGRSGRQGEPGESQFYLSAEDELVQTFGGEKAAALLERVRGAEGGSNKMLSKVIARSQASVEERNAAARQDVLEYAYLDAFQREATYAWRDETLAANGDALLERWVRRAYANVVAQVCAGDRPSECERSEFVDAMNTELLFYGRLPDEAVQVDTEEEAVEIITQAALSILRERFATVPVEARDELLRRYFVACIDLFWTDELEALEMLRQSIELRAALGTDVKLQYSQAAGELYEEVLGKHERRALARLWHMQLSRVEPGPEQGAEPPEDTSPASGQATAPAAQGDDVHGEGAHDSGRAAGEAPTGGSIAGDGEGTSGAPAP